MGKVMGLLLSAEPAVCTEVWRSPEAIGAAWKRAERKDFLLLRGWQAVTSAQLPTKLQT